MHIAAFLKFRNSLIFALIVAFAQPLGGRGIAGGEKYIVNSILFKFAVDSGNLFDGDDGRAAKVAALDLLGLNAMFAAAWDLEAHTTSDLNFPLMSLVDYRGYRLIAMSLLPIGRDTVRSLKFLSIFPLSRASMGLKV